MLRRTTGRSSEGCAADLVGERSIPATKKTTPGSPLKISSPLSGSFDGQWCQRRAWETDNWGAIRRGSSTRWPFRKLKCINRLGCCCYCWDFFSVSFLSCFTKRSSHGFHPPASPKKAMQFPLREKASRQAEPTPQHRRSAGSPNGGNARRTQAARSHSTPSCCRPGMERCAAG